MEGAPSQSFFATFLNQVFRVQSGPAPLDLQLIECGRLAGHKHGTAEPPEAFSLTFRGPVSPVLPQATYSLQNAQAEALQIFLVPVGADSNGVLYQAIFN